jgi:hypothetical protein
LCLLSRDRASAKADAWKLSNETGIPLVVFTVPVSSDGRRHGGQQFFASKTCTTYFLRYLKARSGASFASTATLWGFDEIPFKATRAMSLEIYDLCPLAGYPEKYFSCSSLLIGSTLYKIARKETIDKITRTQAVSDVQRLESRKLLVIRDNNKYVLDSMIIAARDKMLEEVTVLEIHEDLRESVLEQKLAPVCMPGVFRLQRIGRKDGEPLPAVTDALDKLHQAIKKFEGPRQLKGNFHEKCGRVATLLWDCPLQDSFHDAVTSFSCHGKLPKPHQCIVNCMVRCGLLNCENWQTAQVPQWMIDYGSLPLMYKGSNLPRKRKVIKRKRTN